MDRRILETGAGIVDDPVGAERANGLQAPLADAVPIMRAAVLGKLDGKAPDPAGGAVDQHPLTLLQAPP